MVKGVWRFKFPKLLYLPVLILALAAGVIYIKDPQLFKSKAGTFNEIGCNASTYSAFKSCFSRFKQGEVNVINVTKSITCDASQPCNFAISDITNGKITTPNSDRSVGFVRNGKYDGPVFRITNSKNITISNLFIDDNKNQPLCAYPDANCRPQIIINDSQDIIMDNLFLLNSKAQAVSMSGAKNVVFKNSTLLNSFLQGIWMTRADGVKISNSIFENTHAAAILLQGNNIEVLNNTLVHNHWSPPWKIQGGQLSIAGANHVRIDSNSITNGSYEGFVTPGIEFDVNHSNNDVVISNNVIKDNTGWGIVKGKTTIISGVVIANNTLSSNLKPMIMDWEGVNSWTLRNNNCGSVSCTSVSGLPEDALNINQIGITKNFNPWALWFTGIGLKDNLTVKLYYNSSQWGSDLRMEYNEEQKFGVIILPSNVGPGSCNKAGTCQLKAIISDGQNSASKTFSLPQY